MSGVTRRDLLCGLGVAGAAGLVSAALPARVSYATTTVPDSDVLVVLSLRGGFDGLSAIVPTADPHYAALRPGIGVPQRALLPLTSTFGMHPALAPLKPFWDKGDLAVVHAVGSPDPSRSHFEAERSMERAAFGSTLTTGWLDRLLSSQVGNATFRAVQMDHMLPQSLMGPAPVLAFDSLGSFGLDVWEGIRPQYQKAVGALYSNVTHPMGAQATRTLKAVSAVGALTATPYVPANGAAYPTGGLGDTLKDVARLVKSSLHVQVACVELGNWDMHEGLGAVDSGWMHDQLKELGQALAAFATDLGATRMANVTVVTMSEFGRRVEQNGSGGVDHGHGNAMLLLGGGVNGKKLYGKWPGLAPAALDDGDLAVTTDYRSVLAEVLRDRCGSTALSTVFPGFRPTTLGVTATR